jgi:hypothetical protein
LNDIIHRRYIWPPRRAAFAEVAVRARRGQTVASWSAGGRGNFFRRLASAHPGWRIRCAIVARAELFATSSGKRISQCALAVADAMTICQIVMRFHDARSLTPFWSASSIVPSCLAECQACGSEAGVRLGDVAYAWSPLPGGSWRQPLRACAQGSPAAMCSGSGA